MISKLSHLSKALEGWNAEGIFLNSRTQGTQ